MPIYIVHVFLSVCFGCNVKYNIVENLIWNFRDRSTIIFGLILEAVGTKNDFGMQK